MTRWPSRTGREAVLILKRAGFEVIRVKGSHHVLRHPDGRTTTVPVHTRETLGPGLMQKMLRDCELTRDEFESLA